jgi:hypothetical protein
MACPHWPFQSLVDCVKGNFQERCQQTGLHDTPSPVQMSVVILSQQDTVEAAIDFLARLPTHSQSLHGAIFDIWYSDEVQLQMIPWLGYGFVANLQAHHEADKLLGLLYNVWLGKAPMHALIRMATLLQEVASIIGALRQVHTADSPGAGVIPQADFGHLLQRLCPAKGKAQLQSLAGSLPQHKRKGFVDVNHITLPAGKDWVQLYQDAHAAVHLQAAGRDSTQASRSAVHQQCQDVPDVDRAGTSAPEADLAAVVELAVLETTQQPLDSGTPVGARVGLPGTTADPCIRADCEQQHGQCGSGTNERSCGVGAGGLVAELLQQHAAALVQVRESVHAAVRASEELPTLDGDGLSALSTFLASLEKIDPLTIPGCVHAWCQAGDTACRDDFAQILLATAPIQSKQDYDAAAAYAWVSGLEGRGSGLGSAALLPDVA